MRIFENRILRKLFELKREEVTGKWRRLPSLELNAVYPSPNNEYLSGDQIKKNGLGWARMFWWRPEEKT
jgi:hypothetical protein